jgi:hypothetical protein
MQKKSYPKPKQWYPKNPKKYIGDVNNIWYRSSWEKKVLNWLDNNPNVIEYSSEEIKIPYLSPIDSKYHTYYPDVYAKIKNNQGKIVEYLIEIKPYAQTIEPEVKKRITKTYINEVYTWGINSAKWKFAKEFCRKRNWEFKFLTEKDIF